MARCTYHCRACGRHFHSLAAFDAHRIGDHASNDPEIRRRCESPTGILDKTGGPQLVALDEHGVCDITEVRYEDATIWTVRRDLERARERWGKDRGSRQAVSPNASEAF